MSEEVLAAIASLAAEVRDLRRQVKQQSALGLSRGWFKLYVERDGLNVWHTREGDQKVNVPETTLTGYIEKLQYWQGEEGKSDRLHIYIYGDRTYQISTGLETYFAKEFMAAIATMTTKMLRGPISLYASVGDPKKSHSKACFANVSVNGTLIKPTRLRGKPAIELLQRAQIAIARAHGEIPLEQPRRIQEAVNWAKVCKDYDLTAKQLEEIAIDIGLPVQRLDRSQSATLLNAVMARRKTA